MNAADKLYKAVINVISMLYFDPLTLKGLKTRVMSSGLVWTTLVISPLATAHVW